MTRKVVRKRIVLTIAGIFLSLFLLELLLRAAGFLLLSYQEYNNRASLKKRGTYRIMCLGESTTMCSRCPVFLKMLLRQGNPGIEFSVINRGVTSANSSYILEHLESNLRKFRPDMVIVMMGINDKGIKYYENMPEAPGPLFRHIRIYRLFRLLSMRVREGLKGAYASILPQDDAGTENPQLPSDPDSYISLGRKYYDQGRYYEAEKAFERASELNPRDDAVYVELAKCYANTGGQLERAIDVLKKAVSLNRKNDMAYRYLGSYYFRLRRHDEAGRMYRKAIALNPGNYDAYLGLAEMYNREFDFKKTEKVLKELVDKGTVLSGLWAYSHLGWYYLKQGRFGQLEELLVRAESGNRANCGLYGMLAVLYEAKGDRERAAEYYRKSRQMREEEFSLMTARNYRRLKSILDREGIRLVCIQYPMCSIEPLKKIFGQDEGVIFVDNENVFRDAVSRNGYGRYFIDMFGGGFGHTSVEGDKLLARNISDCILKEVFNRKRAP